MQRHQVPPRLPSTARKNQSRARMEGRCPRLSKWGCRGCLGCRICRLRKLKNKINKCCKNSKSRSKKRNWWGRIWGYWLRSRARVLRRGSVINRLVCSLIGKLTPRRPMSLSARKKTIWIYWTSQRKSSWRTIKRCSDSMRRYSRAFKMCLLSWQLIRRKLLITLRKAREEPHSQTKAQTIEVLDAKPVRVRWPQNNHYKRRLWKRPQCCVIIWALIISSWALPWRSRELVPQRSGRHRPSSIWGRRWASRCRMMSLRWSWRIRSNL